MTEMYKIINAIPEVLEKAAKSLERWQNPNFTVQRGNSGRNKKFRLCEAQQKVQLTGQLIAYS